jgi:hypothetical protein
MPRILHKLRIDEVSHVDRGAGEGVKVVMLKRDCDADLIEKRRSPRNAPSGEGPAHDEYALRFEILRRGTALRPSEELHAKVWNSMTEAEQMQLLAEEGRTLQQREFDREAQMKKIDSAEMFADWWSELSAQERDHYRRQQADIDAQIAERERLSRAGTTTRAEVAPTTPSPQPKKARDDNSLNSILKSYGVCAVAKLVVDTNDAHLISEAELVQAASHYAASKGMKLGALLSAQNGEGALLAKAASVCRRGEQARQAERNLADARLRQRS